MPFQALAEEEKRLKAIFKFIWTAKKLKKHKGVGGGVKKRLSVTLRMTLPVELHSQERQPTIPPSIHLPARIGTQLKRERKRKGEKKM